LKAIYKISNILNLFSFGLISWMIFNFILMCQFNLRFWKRNSIRSFHKKSVTWFF